MKRINVKCKFCGKINQNGESYCNFGCRFKKYTKKIENGCLEWMGSRDLIGYGQFCDKNKKFIFAHRETYKFYKGEFDRKLNVCHLCDNPSCVNPEHLWLGTAKDNHEDMIKKGRQGHGAPKGIECHAAKLDDKKVKEIKILLEIGVTQTMIAEIYNISQTTVWEIMKRRTWKHIE